MDSKPPVVTLVSGSPGKDPEHPVREATRRAAVSAGWSLADRLEDVPPETTHAVFAAAGLLIGDKAAAEWDFSTPMAECSFGPPSLVSFPVEMADGVAGRMERRLNLLDDGFCKPFPDGFVQQHFDPDPFPGPCVDFTSAAAGTFRDTFDAWVSGKVISGLLPPDSRPLPGKKLLVVPFFGVKASRGESMRHLLRLVDKHWTGNYQVFLAGDHHPSLWLHDKERTGFIQATGFLEMLHKLKALGLPFTLLSVKGLPCAPLDLDQVPGFLDKVAAEDISNSWKSLCNHAGACSQGAGRAGKWLRESGFKGVILRPVAGFPLTIVPDELARLLADFPRLCPGTLPVLHTTLFRQGKCPLDRILRRGCGQNTAIRILKELLISQDEMPDPVLRRYLVLTSRPCRFERPKNTDESESEN